MRASCAVLLLLLTTAVAPAIAQSPNTSGLVVVVVDQTGAVVPDASVTVRNTDTGTVREATSTADGSATIAALPLMGVLGECRKARIHGRRCHGPGASSR